MIKGYHDPLIQLKIEDATPESIDDVFNETMSVLQETGYSQVLTFSNKSQAVTALKGHFLLYRLMAPINQFVEGKSNLQLNLS